MEQLNEIKRKEFDCIIFTKDENEDLSVKLVCLNEPGEKIPGSTMGDYYDIIVTPNDLSNPPDRFKAILVSPVDYMYRMYRDGFFGVICRATTKTDEMMDKNYEMVLDVYEKDVASLEEE